MSDLSDVLIDWDDQYYLGLRFFDLLRATSDGDHERLAQCIEELAAWGISIEIAGSDKH